MWIALRLWINCIEITGDLLPVVMSVMMMVMVMVIPGWPIWPEWRPGWNDDTGSEHDGY